MYFTNVLNAKYYPPMSSGTWDDTGARYNISLIYGTVNLLIGVAVSAFFMGYVYRYHLVWFCKYNYLLGVGFDCSI